MTTPACPLDGKPIHDNAAICAACGADLTQALAELPGLIDDLELTLSRQTALGQRNGGRSSEKALPYDVRASDTLQAARVVLVGWVNVLHQEGPELGGEWAEEPWPYNTLRSMAEWLYARVDRARRHEAGAEIAAEVRDLSSQMRKTSDLALYRAKFALGPCVNQYEDGSPCGGEIWAFIPADEARVAVMRCIDCRHEWTPDQWLAISPEILRKVS